MKVRELIAALVLQDPEMEVVIPADPELGCDYAFLGGAVPDVLAPCPPGPDDLHLAEMEDTGSLVAFRLFGIGVDPQAARFRQ